MNEKWSYILFKRQLEDKLQYLQSQSKGTNTRYLTLGILNELRFVVPPVAEQEQFATFVEQTDKSKVAVQKALDETQLLFDSLMQNILDNEENTMDAIYSQPLIEMGVSLTQLAIRGTATAVTNKIKTIKDEKAQKNT